MSRDSVIVDARGHKCPVPSLKLQKAMQVAGHSRAQFCLLATDPMARIDVPFLMQQAGGRVLHIEEAEGVLQITVEIGDDLPD